MIHTGEKWNERVQVIRFRYAFYEADTHQGGAEGAASKWLCLKTGCFINILSYGCCAEHVSKTI